MEQKRAETKWFRLVLARQKEFESPTFRLGGGRSIQLSYWRIFTFGIVAKKIFGVNRISGYFSDSFAYITRSGFERSGIVKESNDPYADLDDLIFGEGDGLPSER